MNQENLLNIVSTATNSVPLNLEITFTAGDHSLKMPFNDFNIGYFNAVKDKLSPILNKIVTNLIKSRDFLGLQLDLEFENISSEQYEQMEMDSLTELVEIDPNLLKNDIDILIKLTNRPYNSEEISTMFNCNLDAAEKAIELLLIDEA